MKPFLFFYKPTQAAAMLMIFIFTGCGRDDVKVYKTDSADVVPAVPTPAPAVAMPAAMPTTMPAGLPAPDHSALPPLKYVLPAGWTEKPLTTMRVASFSILENNKQADASVIPMDGIAGGVTANVTRWRGQVGLPEVTADEAAKLAEKVSVGDQPADLFDLAGGGQRILAVIFHRDDTAWFFKITGDDALVEKQKAAFVSFLKTVQFGEPKK
jgi:hypothetical protein